MFVTVLLLSLSTFVSSLNTCENCVPVTKCDSATQLISHDRSEKTINILRKKLCGFDQSLSLPKICCDNFDIPEKVQDHHNINLLPTNCGHIISDRLLGGYVVWDHEFPWVVRIAYENNGTYSFQCLGTLINSRYVLTSADCVMGRRIAGVRVGGRTRSFECTDVICERNQQDIQVTEQITHPKFMKHLRTVNNIGLLRLRNSVDLTKESAGVICLPLIEEHRNRNITGNIGTVSYWAENEREIKSTFPTSIYSTKRCELYINKHINNESSLLRNTICTQRNDTNHCDSMPGAPLMLVGSYPDSYKYLQYGILITAKTECGPEIYTDVRKYTNWILDTIKY